MPDSDVEFMDVKIGSQFFFNGYPVELISVGNLLVAGGNRVEVITLQKLEETAEELTPLQKLMEVLTESQFTPPVAREIIGAALGRLITKVSDLTEQECDVAEAAINSAVLDREQLKEQR